MSPPSSASQLTPSEYLRVWWAIIWRNSLFGFIAGSLLGGLAGALLAAFGYARFGAAAGAVAGGIANIAISFFVIRHVLAKRFAGFKLIVERQVESGS
jgi:hypothetical protein